MKYTYSVRKGKRLAYLLRHAQSTSGLPRSLEGWMPVEAVKKTLNLSQGELDALVAQDPKGRYEYSEGKASVRARQGHSVKVELPWEKQVPPEILYHGTVEQALAGIRASGLKPMGRHAVHLSGTLETATKVASRRGAPVILQVRARALSDEGASFTLTPNGVWLVAAVPSEYLIFP